MIVHKVKVYSSKSHLPKKSQLAWKIAKVSSDNAKLNKNSIEMVINRIIDNASVAIASLNRKPVISSRERALKYSRKNGATLFGIKNKLSHDIVLTIRRKEMNLKNRTVLVSGGSRGIGLAIAKKLGENGANIVIAAKTVKPHPKLPGTIYTAAKEVEQLGATCLPIECDIRFEEQVQATVETCVKEFGGIDICVNNASAIAPFATSSLDMKRYDLMQDINTRGSFLLTKTRLLAIKSK